MFYTVFCSSKACCLKSSQDGSRDPQHSRQDLQRGPQDPRGWPPQAPLWAPRPPTWPPRSPKMALERPSMAPKIPNMAPKMLCESLLPPKTIQVGGNICGLGSGLRARTRARGLGRAPCASQARTSLPTIESKMINQNRQQNHQPEFEAN